MFRLLANLKLCLCVAFLPGSYASYILVGACRGWKGYHYDDVPSYDEY